MARIVNPEPVEVQAPPAWKIPGEEVVTIALDCNEAVAVLNAMREYHKRVSGLTKNPHGYGNGPTSLNASGARVYEALHPVVKENGWS